MFLQELDRIEKRKHEEQEREVLIKAAKVSFGYLFNLSNIVICC